MFLWAYLNLIYFLTSYIPTECLINGGSFQMDFIRTQLSSEQVPKSQECVLSSFEHIFNILHSKRSNLTVQNALKYRWLSLRS